MARTRRSTAAEESSAKRAKTEDAAEAKTFEVGDSLPDVEVVLQNEEKVDLAKEYKSGVLVIFSYPKASTPGCTRQTSGFGESYDEFKKLGAAVYGLSADSPKAQTTFKEKTGVAFDLISDPSYELLGPLSAKKSPKGVVRSHFVFKDGKAVLVEHGVKPDDSPKITLAKVKEIVDANGSSKEEDAAESKSEVKEDEGEAADEEEEEPEAEESEAEETPASEDEEEEAGQDQEEEEDGEYGEEEEAEDAAEEENDAEDAEKDFSKADDVVDESKAEQINGDESKAQEAEAEKEDAEAEAEPEPESK